MRGIAFIETVKNFAANKLVRRFDYETMCEKKRKILQ